MMEILALVAILAIYFKEVPHHETTQNESRVLKAPVLLDRFSESSEELRRESDARRHSPLSDALSGPHRSQQEGLR